MKILIVDNDRTMLLALSQQLKKLGHQVISPTTLTDIIPLYKAESPDLVLLDIVMDSTIGYDCARRIRALEEKTWVPIIFLTDNVVESAIIEGIEAGGDDYLTKPVNEAILQAKIHGIECIVKMQHALVSANQRLEKLSITDTLTGIANRLFFEKTIRKTIASAIRHKRKFAVMYIDLDNFKTINDSLGHQYGDFLLKSAADRMKSILRQEDFIARLGGDEFAIILEDIQDNASAEYVARKLVELFKPYFLLNEHKISTSISIGLAIYPRDGHNLETLIKNVDIAMYQAKESGRNNFQFFTDDLNKSKEMLGKYELALRYALSNDELSLVYQAKFNLLTHEIVGIESLIRWNNNMLGEISPDIFIPIAEKTGLINAIGRWVIENVCQQYYIWQQENLNHFNIAINLSPLQLRKEGFDTHLKNTLNTYDINPNQIELEITETAVMSTDKISERLLSNLHAMGITLTIDDFGTGYSSLNHLKRLPIHTLKIDKEFVMDIPNDENDMAIVKTVISLSKSLGLNVIAEGIETAEQKAFLMAHGCTIGQGFYLSKPLTAESMTTLLKNAKNL